MRQFGLVSTAYGSRTITVRFPHRGRFPWSEDTYDIWFQKAQPCADFCVADSVNLRKFIRAKQDRACQRLGMEPGRSRANHPVTRHGSYASQGGTSRSTA